MGLFGGSKSYSGSGQKWATPFAKAAAGSVQGVFDANQGQLQNTTNTVNSFLPKLEAGYNSWSPLTEQSKGYYSDVIGGKYLDPSSNPGLSGLLARTRADVANDVNSQFSMAGRYGSGAHTGVLTDHLADAENKVLYGNYQAERANQQAAAGAPIDAQSSSLAQLLQTAGVGAELPYTGANSLASGLSALFSGGTQKTSAGIGGVLQGIGSIASAAAGPGGFSDRRLKTNIRKIGEFADGLGRYVWTYIWGGPEYEGVMADEVEALRPWALGPKVAGYATVNYGAL